jgi:hypothetical protein
MEFSDIKLINMYKSFTMMRAVILVSLILPVLERAAQNVKMYRQPVEDQYVPKIVRNNFRTQYPQSAISIWYISHIIYWYEDYAPVWYADWYDSGRRVTIYTFEYPAYYEVDFYRNQLNSPVIFNHYGHWFETRTRISELPDPDAKTLREEGFPEHALSNHRERIEAPDMTGSVYRLQAAELKRSTG